jgi:deazaflavin-dependent oxidoreductase (nitroreductase family)
MSLYDTIFSTTLRVHEFVYKNTDGLIGHRVLGVTTLLLRTTGRKSGKTRTNALVYASDDGGYLVVPSNGGADRPPGWLHNIQAKPLVEVQIGRSKGSATASVVQKDDPDFERLWELVNRNNGDRYKAYQRKTAREIPVVVLRPS